MKLRISKIHAAAAARPPGYVAAVMAAGVAAGEWLEIDPAALAALREQFRPKSPPSPPSVPVMAATLARAAAAETAALLAGVPPLDAAQIAARLEICRGCGEFIPGQNRCALCGCFAALKTRLRSQHCPAARW